MPVIFNYISECISLIPISEVVFMKIKVWHYNSIGYDAIQNKFFLPSDWFPILAIRK